MSSILDIDDIRLIVFEYVERGDLARLARTCKRFTDDSVEYLWRTLTSLQPLMSCLPPGIRSHSASLDDISRLDFYSRKVRRLILNEDGAQGKRRLPAPFGKMPPRCTYADEHASIRFLKKKPIRRDLKAWRAAHISWAEFWARVAELRPQHHFLPNLVHLHIGDIHEELLLPLVGISCSRLEHIHIGRTIKQPDVSILSQFLNTVQHTPKLKHLFVPDAGRSCAHVPPMLNIKPLIKQSPLTYLHIHLIKSPTHCEQYSQQQHTLPPEIFLKTELKHVSLTLARGWHNPDIFEQTRTDKDDNTDLACCPRGFPNLQALQLNIREWQGISPAAFVRRLNVTSQTLKLLQLNFQCPISSEGFADVVHAANDGGRLENLHELDIKSGSQVTGDNRPCLTLQQLKTTLIPLLPLPYLSVLRLSLTPHILQKLDLAFFRCMADGLPELQTLSIGIRGWIFKSEWAEARGFDLNGDYEKVPLVNLAAFCHMFPKLVEVSATRIDSLRRDYHNTFHEDAAHWVSRSVRSLNLVYCVQHRNEEQKIPVWHQMERQLNQWFPNVILARGTFQGLI